MKIDFTKNKVYKNDKELDITKTELELIKCFLSHKGMILTRKKLLDIVWGFDYFGEERTVDTHVRRLRKKVGENIIKTHRGLGIVWRSRVNKLGKKLFLSISLTVILIFTISLLIINYLLPKYNIYKTRENLNEFTVQIQNTPVNELEDVIRTIESENNVTFAYTSINQSEDDMNESLRMQLTKKKVVLNKLWITKDAVMKVKVEGQSNKLYDQEKLKASFSLNILQKIIQ